MRVGITGGTGNISQFVTKYLLERNCEVVLFNNEGVSGGQYNQTEIILCDRYNREDFLEKVAAAGEFDCIIDMICYEPKDAQVLIDAFGGRVKQVVFSSTVDVYTKDPRSYPITEAYERKSRVSFPYAYKKAACEEMLFRAAQKGVFEVTMIRPAATYSEGAGGSPIVHPFRGGTYHFDRLLKGKEIVIHGDGSSIWTMTHASDVGRAYSNAVGNENAYGKAYNICGEEYYSYRQYFEIIREAIGAPPLRLVYIPTDLLFAMMPEVADWCMENFQYNSIYDNSAAKRDLDFKYTVSLGEGTRRCMEYLTQGRGLDDSDLPEFSFYDKVIKSYKIYAGQLVEYFHKLDGK